MKELLAEKKNLIDAVGTLNVEREGLVAQVKELARRLERIKERAPSKSPVRTDKGGMEVFTEIVEKTGMQGHAGRSPMKVEVLVETVEEISRSSSVLRKEMRERTRSRPRRSDDPVMDKENIRGGNDDSGRIITGRVKKLVGAWSQIVELVESFDGLSRDFEKVNAQIKKDKNRMEGLIKKSPELTPYFREICKILNFPPTSEQLLKTGQELSASESSHLSKSITYFEKLFEEFGHVFGSFSEKLKIKKGDYLKWNKRLAAYCHQNFPQYDN